MRFSHLQSNPATANFMGNIKMFLSKLCCLKKRHAEGEDTEAALMSEVINWMKPVADNTATLTEVIDFCSFFSSVGVGCCAHEFSFGLKV